MTDHKQTATTSGFFLEKACNPERALTALLHPTIVSVEVGYSDLTGGLAVFVTRSRLSDDISLELSRTQHIHNVSREHIGMANQLSTSQKLLFVLVDVLWPTICWQSLTFLNEFKIKQGKSEGFDNCDRPSNLAQIWSKSSIFQPVWPWNFMDDLGKQ